MKQCLNCGIFINPDDPFCNRCGASQAASPEAMVQTQPQNSSVSDSVLQNSSVMNVSGGVGSAGKVKIYQQNQTTSIYDYLGYVNERIDELHDELSERSTKKLIVLILIFMGWLGWLLNLVPGFDNAGVDFALSDIRDANLSSLVFVILTILVIRLGSKSKKEMKRELKELKREKKRLIKKAS